MMGYGLEKDNPNFIFDKEIVTGYMEASKNKKADKDTGGIVIGRKADNPGKNFEEDFYQKQHGGFNIGAIAGRQYSEDLEYHNQIAYQHNSNKFLATNKQQSLKNNKSKFVSGVKSNTTDIKSLNNKGKKGKVEESDINFDDFLQKIDITIPGF